MTDRLDGSVALITGASSGIGAATSRALAARGAHVALLARRADRLGELAREIELSGGVALPITVDLTEPSSVEAAIGAAIKGLGRLDIVVNDAGVMLKGPVLDAPLAEWDQMINVNIRALLYVTRFALAHLIQAAESGTRGVADLVNVSADSGRRAMPGSAVYDMTKFAVIGFSESLRQEVARRGVRVSLVEPGAVRTELADHVRPEIKAIPDPDFVGFDFLAADDIADVISYIVTRPLPMAVHEVLVRPAEQLV